MLVYSGSHAFSKFEHGIKSEEIKKMSIVVTHRMGDTGIGKTLEDLLGITENNIAGPDFCKVINKL